MTGISRGIASNKYKIKQKMRKLRISTEILAIALVNGGDATS